MLYQRLLLAACLATWVLIVVGAVVRVTGSGLGCPDWPQCHGQLIPPPDMAAILEYSHRITAAFDTVLLLGVVAATWLTRRDQPGLLIAATAIPLLLTGQIALGAVTVLLELPPAIVLVHLLTAMVILGILVWMAANAGGRGDSLSLDGREGERGCPGGAAASRARLRSAATLSTVCAVAGFLLLFSGSLVRATGATWACAGFPTCNGQLIPFGVDRLMDLHLAHRLAAYAFIALLGACLVRAWGLRDLVPVLRWIVPATGLAVALQFLIGAGAVSSGVPTLLRGAHVAGAAAVWAFTVALASLLVRAVAQPSTPARTGERERWSGSARISPARGAAVSPAPAEVSAENETPAREQGPGPTAGRRAMQVVRAYFALTKPRIIVLLLVTTATSMMIAARGVPSLGLLLATLLGGALSAGAANTFNCYLDRDIDALMTRTARRPLVSGAISPASALVFGFLLAVLAVTVLGVWVNWLAAFLSLSGLLYYVFVYTCWLKRTTPSNIVIGGAAGAVPPLVGWAAVTGEVSLLAVYLFAVIFFWTPPHFWALALLIKREYERASVPMLPNVRGDDETRRQMLIYTVVLVLFTLAVVFYADIGAFYVTAAALLGAVFLYYAVNLLRQATQQAARGMFRYSILYLALLFFAMVVDQWRGV